MKWWIRPLVRIIAAMSLPFVVPAAITGILWALPGEPVTILCPDGLCSKAQQDALAEHLHMNDGPSGFFLNWLSLALHGDFGRSLRVMQGEPVVNLLWESAPATTELVLLALIPVIGLSLAAALGWLPRRLDGFWQALGLIPSVILALLFAAIVEINFGAMSHEGLPDKLRLIFGAIVLGVADGTLGGAILGTRSIFDEEVKQRYVQIAVLRGETVLGNALPNVLPALVGQFRGRILHILSGAVIVEVVLGISGVGELLWDGTLLQDFVVVLAAAWVFAILSGVLLLIQAVAEVLVEMHVRRAPGVPLDAPRLAAGSPA